VLAALAVGLTAAPLLANQAEPARAALVPPISGSAVLSGSPAASSEVATGVLQRVSVEHEGATTRGTRPSTETPTATMTAWLDTDSGHIQLPLHAMNGIATGATVAVTLGATVQGESVSGVGTTRMRKVASVRVLSPARSRVTAAATQPHAITVILALPPGAKRDTTTTASLTQRLDTAVAPFWSQQTGGRFSFSVTKAVGWTTLTHPCSDIWGLWDEARVKAGFTPGTRRHLMVYVPPTTGCPTGLGTVGDGVDAGGYTFVGGTADGLLAHELGHNLSLGHSNALHCAGVADAPFVSGGYNGACSPVDYGDWYDVMGISWDNLGTLSTAHAFRLGVLGTDQVRTVTGPARVVLQPVSTRIGLRSLRIKDPAGATYVVEYRPASGTDSWLGTSDDWRGILPGVLVRRVDPADATQTLLLDPTPSTGSAAGSDWDFVLDQGQTLTSASGRVQVRVDALTSGSAVVSVSLDHAWPALLAGSGGKLLDGRQVTVGDAPAAWAAAAH
jgi:hypothetical protein